VSTLADLRAGWTLPADCVALQFSRHARDRYAQRVRPSLQRDHIAAELSALLATARVTHKRPEWLASTENASAWLMLTDDIVAPLCAHGDELIASTVVMRRMVEGKRRSDWNSAAAQKRAGRKGARKAKKHERGRPHFGPSANEW
jgi:hypothetical protein